LLKQAAAGVATHPRRAPALQPLIAGRSSRWSDDSGQLLREFTLANAFSLAFAFISPIVGFIPFLLGFAPPAPGFGSAFYRLAGQLLVALVFCPC